MKPKRTLNMGGEIFFGFDTALEFNIWVVKGRVSHKCDHIFLNHRVTCLKGNKYIRIPGNFWFNDSKYKNQQHKNCKKKKVFMWPQDPSL